jgi:tetratricopeptide (TPR) repeat protein
LIDLGSGQKKSFDAIGYSVNTISEKEIESQYLNLQDLLAGKFAGLTMSGSSSASSPPIIYMRNNNSANNEVPAIFDIDGTVFETWPNIEIQNIKNITILKSLAAVTKYGTIGRGGVVVIKTKTASGGEAEPKAKSALAQGNTYEETLNNFSNNKHASSELLALQKASTFAEAKAIYKRQQQSEAQLGIPYYLEASDYFLKWDQQYANAVLNTITKIAFNNPKALLTLAYKLEAQHKYTKARDIYQRIAILRPKDAQSYRNLAHIYELTGYYQNAMDLYKQMLGNTMEDVDFSGLQKVLANELAHLVALHRNKVNYKGLPADFLSAKFKFDTRIVFEWNEPSTEFELQFVNPIKKFYKWSHTQLENKERMVDEVKNGYATQEYIIDDAEAGEWIINIESLTEETNAINPSYLKYTVYKNYGLPNETQEVKVVKLSDCKPKVTFDKLVSK